MPETAKSRIRRYRASDSGVSADPGRSLRVACLVWIGLWSLGLFMNHVVGPLISPDQPLDDAWPWPGSPVAVACIAFSVLLFVYAKRGRASPERLLDLALLYELMLSFGIGVVNQWTPNTVGLSWICVVILVHPLLVPVSPGKAQLVAFAAASMDLVGLAITRARGVELPPASALLWTYLPNYICAALAGLPTHIRFKMEQERVAAREFGSYRLGALLGRGGMGEIYRAEHRMLARPAALKLVRPELLGAGDIDQHRRVAARFEREAQVTAGLRSPHTVSIYDYGITDDGTFYYVMELLDGLDLEILVREFGPVAAPRAIHILKQLCDSLAEAHERGLIHRDVKPSNVFLCRYGRRADFVKVLDFGLARPLDVASGDPTLTQVGAAGTPAFMAPEQVLGGGTGPWTDIYAVGCVAYWLLTGALVFDGMSAVAVMAAHAKETPVRPSLRTEMPIPARLEEIVLACLAKEPARRPGSAEELADLLDGAVPEDGWTGANARRWWDAHRPDAGKASRYSTPARPA